LVFRIAAAGFVHYMDLHIQVYYYCCTTGEYMYRVHHTWLSVCT
jgi:hypothetical protein